MKEKPIFFSTEMVQAILDGKKTQTRRVIKPRYRNDEAGFEVSIGVKYGDRRVHIIDKEGGMTRDYSPPYKVGDILWAREAWRVSHLGTGSGDWAGIVYKTGKSKTIDIDEKEILYFAGKTIWQSPIFMPKRAARIFLEVKSVRVERLQDISEADAMAEGVEARFEVDLATFIDKAKPIISTYRIGFKHTWDSINSKRGYSWNSNPWVFVYEFEKMEGK
jgi:hypothetical protein